jgi:hypothetical protein
MAINAAVVNTEIKLKSINHPRRSLASSSRQRREQFTHIFLLLLLQPGRRCRAAISVKRSFLYRE